jgi:phage terminase small subunit
VNEVRVSNYELAEYDYMSGMKYKEISEKYNVTINTVKTWKQRYGWSKNNKKSVHTKNEKVCTQKTDDKPIDDGTKETMLNESLTHEQRLFCIYYSKIFNAAQSYQKAYGCTYESALSAGPRLFGNVEVKKEIQRLSLLKAEQAAIGENDLLELHMRIAFSDIGNYISFGREEVPVMTMFGQMEDKETGEKVTKVVNSIKVNESTNVDTQIIQEVKQGKDGFSIKLADKNKSMEWLDRFFLTNPMDRHKIEYDKLKLELEQKKAEPENKAEIVKYTGIPAVMIAPSFIKVVHDIEEQIYNEYVFPGGRGSTKSSFISLQVIDLLEKNSDMHAAVFRQVGQTLRDSVYAQMCWAITVLGLESEYICLFSTTNNGLCNGSDSFFTFKLV